ncbi:MAG: ATP-binding protein, partial [Cyanobacteria bacterium J069]
MLQIFGDFQDDQPPSEEFLSLAFSPSSAPIR